MTDWKENESYLHKKFEVKKWNFDFPIFDCTYLWRNCRDIWRTKLMNLLLCSFECPYLWRNYQTKLRTSIINMLLWSKLFWNKYVRKYTFRTEEQFLGRRHCQQGDSSLPLYVPRVTAHYLYTYHISPVRTIKSNQYEPIGTILYTNFRFESKSILARTEPFSFSFTCTYRTILTCSSPRRPLFLHALSFECTSNLCGTLLNQFLVFFHIKKTHNTI